MATSPLVAQAGAITRDVLAAFGLSTLRVTLTRPAEFGAYDAATDTFTPGAPFAIAAEGFWGTLGATPATEATAGEGATRTEGRRALVILGDSIHGPAGTPAAAAIPRTGDTARIPGEPTSYVLSKVTPRAAPSGGLGPLYYCEAGF